MKYYCKNIFNEFFLIIKSFEKNFLKINSNVFSMNFYRKNIFNEFFNKKMLF